MGKDFADRVYDKESEESYEKILEHFKRILPDVGEAALKKFLRN